MPAEDDSYQAQSTLTRLLASQALPPILAKTQRTAEHRSEYRGQRKP